MKLRFILLSIMLLFVRGCDFYSTSLWVFQENGMADETNPLTQFFDVGWNGLLIANFIVISIVLIMFYYYCFKYKPRQISNGQPKNFIEYTSLQYYNQPNKFHQIFYKIPKNKSILIAHSGYVLIHSIIIGSILATIHNLGQFYQLEFYQTFREIVGRPQFVIYGLIIFSIIGTFIHLLKKEFEDYMKEYINIV